MRTTPQGYELRVNGTWKPSSREEVQELLDQGWAVLWDPMDYRFVLGTRGVAVEYSN